MRRSFGLRELQDGSARYFTFFCAFVSIATTLGIVWVLFSQAVPFFRAVPLVDFLSGTEWRPTASQPKFGVLPLVIGTLQITIGAGIIAIPLGVLSAVYMSEYASPRVRGILKPALELLAGIPTVVYGYFGLFFVTPMLRKVLPDIQSSNMLAGAVVVGIMILPLVSSLCEDALRAVPRALREAGYGLGATKREVVIKTVIPAAFSGIMAAFVLALSRALGETMAVALAAGVLGDLMIMRLDAQRVGEITGRERERVPESVRRLRRILRDEALRRVAVIADRDLAVTRLEPCGVMLLHDVAVGTGRRIIRQVRRALRVDEGVCADADCQAEGEACRYRESDACHAPGRNAVSP